MFYLWQGKRHFKTQQMFYTFLSSKLQSLHLWQQSHNLFQFWHKDPEQIIELRQGWYQTPHHNSALRWIQNPISFLLPYLYPQFQSKCKHRGELPREYRTHFPKHWIFSIGDGSLLKMGLVPSVAPFMAQKQTRHRPISSSKLRLGISFYV